MSNGRCDYEEALRRLMVPLRARIEGGKAFDRAEVCELLRQVAEYAAESGDIRFADCVQYYSELGIEPAAEEKP